MNISIQPNEKHYHFEAVILSGFASTEYGIFSFLHQP